MWTEEEIQILKNNYDKLYIEDLMKLLPERTQGSIFIKANRLGLKRKNMDSRNRRKYTFDYNYFETINTPNKAYYLGWALTDGNVSNTQYRIKLQEEDYDILKKFSKDINSNYPIYDRDNFQSKELVLSHKKIVEDLYKLGCYPNKTYTLEFPNIDDKYIWDFIKGLFDGDGCYICTNRTKKIGFVSASEKFTYKLSDILKKYGINQTPYKQKNEKFFRIEIKSKKGMKIFIDNILNTKSDFLDRKYNKIIALNKYING